MNSEHAPSAARVDGMVTLPNGRQAIELTDDVHQDEPAAWMVLMHDTTLYEFKVFTEEIEASRCAVDQADESGRDWLIYPLYPTHGIEG